MSDNIGAIGCILLLTIYAIYPNECYFHAEKIIIQVKVLAFNYYLMLLAYLAYRKISADHRRMGVPIPVFHFTPIWRRK